MNSIKNISGMVLICLMISMTATAQNQSSPEFRQKAWQDHLQLKQQSPYAKLKWRAVGSEFMGGRIETIAGHTDRPNTLEVGAGSGYLRKTENNGTHGRSIFVLDIEEIENTAGN